jgi:hypothetical protein
MNLPKTGFLILTSWGMVLCVIKAIQDSVFTWMLEESIPISEMFVIILIAMITTKIHYQKSWRRIIVILIQLIGWCVAFLWQTNRYYKLGASIVHYNWLTGFIYLERSLHDYFVILILFILIWSNWICGIRLVTKPTTLKTISHRFDLGLTSFGVLYIVNLLAVTKGFILPPAQSSSLLLIIFLFLGLFSITIVRITNSPSEKRFRVVKGTGFLLGFVTIVFLICGGLFVYFQTGMRQMAVLVVEILSIFKRPLVTLITAIPYEPITNNLWGKVKKEDIEIASPTLSEWNIIPSIIGIILFLILSFFLFKIIYRLAKWLFGRPFETTGIRKPPNIWNQIFLLAIIIKDTFLYLWSIISFRSENIMISRRYFKQMIFWGGISGIKYHQSETPKEYGDRLIKRYHACSEEIIFIIQTHNMALYGNIKPNLQQIAGLQSAIKRFRKNYFKIRKRVE